MFISYRKLSYFILSSFFIAMFFLLYYSISRLIEIKDPTIFTMSSTVSTYKSLSLDTNGNGRKDTINISIDEIRKEYKIEIINDDNKKHILMPDSKLQTVGAYLPWWPLRITVADINMDKVPEIITQVSRTTNGSPSYIFRWNGSGYAKLLSGEWNGISLIDINSDRVPELVTEERVLGVGDNYTAYTWIVNSYSKIGSKIDSNVRGYDKIKFLTKLLNSPFDDKLPSGKYLNTYFSDEWIKDANNLQYINNFTRNIVGIQLQDYISEETNWDGKDTPKSVKWKLRYIVFRKFGTEVKPENYVGEIETERVETPTVTYKIKSVKFKGQ